MPLDYHEIDMQLAEARDEIQYLKERLDEKRTHVAKAKALAQQQRNNQSLWLTPMSAFGHEIQQALRDLHSVLLDQQ